MDIAQGGVYFCLFIALYFEVFLLISFFEKKPQKKSASNPKHYPSVSMIVPCFNEEKTLAGTVRSLLALDYPKDKLEILIVDDGSTDNTRSIGESFAGHPQVRFFAKENGGKYTALNLGIGESKGELVGCLDADSFVVPDALLEVAKRLEQDEEIMALTPAMKVYQPKTILELMQSVEYTFGIFYKKMFDNLSAIGVLPGPFSIYKREVFDIIGPFRHAHNTEDMEIAFRMHKHGLKIANAHTAFVYTTVPTTVRALLKQRTRWSQGFLQNGLDYKHMFFNHRYGNFGMLVFPFGLLAFCAGLYTGLYAAYRLLDIAITKALSLWLTKIPPQLPTAEHLQWFYINTNMLTVLIVMVFGMTMVAISLGNKMADSRLTLKSFVSYFAFFGILAPIWLARAAFGTILARESTWR